MDDWRIAVELALRLGADFDFAHRRRSDRRVRRGSRPRSPGSTPRCCAAPATVSCSPLSEHTDELVLRTRGFRSSPKTDPVLPGTRSRPKARPRPSSKVSKSPLPTTRPDESRGAGARARACRAGALGMGRFGCGRRGSAARRVRSAPRGGSAALRQRADGQRSARARSRAPAVPAADQPARLALRWAWNRAPR